MVIIVAVSAAGREMIGTAIGTEAGDTLVVVVVGVPVTETKVVDVLVVHEAPDGATEEMVNSHHISENSKPT